MTISTTLLVVLFLTMTSVPAFSVEQASPKQDAKAELDRVIQACVRSEKRDAICDTLAQVRQIGDDAVEWVKAYVHLTPFEYAALTVGNFISTNRARINLQPLFNKEVRNIVDLKNGEVTLILERNF